jgi:hypothetical protein
MKNKLVEKRVIALVFLVLFLSVSILLSIFILTHADHEHSNNGVSGNCVICIQLRNSENILRQFSEAFINILLVVYGVIVLAILRKLIAFYVTFDTPVSMKIRMNN